MMNDATPPTQVHCGRASAANAQLAAFYRAVLLEFTPSLLPRAGEFSYPFLLRVAPPYFEAPMRLMFVGKETNGWCGRLDGFFHDPDTGIEQALQRYEDETATAPSGTPFLDTMGKVARELQRPPRSVLWNNLIKCDWPRGRTDSRTAIDASEHLQGLSKRCLRFEMDLLQPHVIIFATGPTYDRAIRSAFPDRQDSIRHEARALWSFTVSGALCIRLRHPGARPHPRFKPMPTYYGRTTEALRKLWSSHGPERWPPPAQARRDALEENVPSGSSRTETTL